MGKGKGKDTDKQQPCKMANFDSPKPVKAKLQAQLYYNRKRNKAKR